MKILVTGVAGFIGFHVARRLCERGDDVLGIDNLNDYYDVSLKQARLRELEPQRNFRFVKMDIADRDAMEELFAGSRFDRVVHMAAQAGVRYSLENPHAYVQSNVVGFMNILEGCRHQWAEVSPLLCKEGAGGGRQSVGSGVSDHRSQITDHGSREGYHLVYASSSSVYGLNTKMPFSVRDNVDHPISLYAATKKANELMAHTYSHLYGIPTTGLRFFTVYGPWGRPDMALFKFTKAILAGEPIDVYNEGKMRRDFTYIDDIVEGVTRVTDRIPAISDHRSQITDHGSREAVHAQTPAPYKIYNIGSHNPVELMDFIGALEVALGKKAELNLMPMQPGDIPASYADVEDLVRDVGFKPATPVKDGINKFIEWYRSFYLSS